jgi:polysaccharide export outer membrane protein
LGPGDKLQITVFEEPALSGEYPVGDSGAIAVPLIGLVMAQDRTLAELEAALVERVDERVVRAPNVTVHVSAYRPFFILGEVANPGSYPYVPNMSVVTAVAIAGGFTFRANREAVSVTRQTGDRAREGRAGLPARVLPGDVIYVFERHL